MATVVALHHTFVHLKEFVRLYYFDFDNHDDHIIMIFVGLVMSYIFIRMYIVLHDIDDNFNLEPISQTLNKVSSGTERLIRISLFFLVIFCIKPIKFEFLEDIWNQYYFWFQRLGEDFANFVVGIVYGYGEISTPDYTLANCMDDCGNLAARAGYMWDASDSTFPPRFGALLILISLLFVFWDFVALVFRNFAPSPVRSAAVRDSQFPKDSRSIEAKHAEYISETYLGKIHGIRILYQRPLKVALLNGQVAASRLCRGFWQSLSILIQFVAYATSLKLLERACLFGFGLALAASFRIQPHVALSLLVLFGLSTVALSAYQYRIGTKLLEAIVMPFVFVFGDRFGPALCLAVFAFVIFEVFRPYATAQWVYIGYIVLVLLPIAVVYAPRAFYLVRNDASKRLDRVQAAISGVRNWIGAKIRARGEGPPEQI